MTGLSYLQGTWYHFGRYFEKSRLFAGVFFWSCLGCIAGNPTNIFNVNSKKVSLPPGIQLETLVTVYTEPVIIQELHSPG